MINSKVNFKIILGLVFLVFCLFSSQVWAQVATQTDNSSSSVSNVGFIEDSAGLIKAEVRQQIIDICGEIEEKMRIRILIRTEKVESLIDSQTRVEAFFAEWIRSINLDKRGVLIYALLPEGSAHGKVHLRVGIGLKYLITKEMGEKILNQVILPNNATNNDGNGFLEGVSTVKRMLLDELKRDGTRKGTHSSTFNLRSF
ncbi:MAG: TPM domain-containing protein, partial [Candidatus Riflebacteria bacterium]